MYAHCFSRKVCGPCLTAAVRSLRSLVVWCRLCSAPIALAPNVLCLLQAVTIVLVCVVSRRNCRDSRGRAPVVWVILLTVCWVEVSVVPRSLVVPLLCRLPSRLDVVRSALDRPCGSRVVLLAFSTVCRLLIMFPFVLSTFD